MAQTPLIQITRRPPEQPAAPPFRSRARRAGEELCDVCASPIQPEHDHLVNVRARALLCACRPCYLLFTHDGAGGGRFRAVPQRYLALPQLASARDDLLALQVPVGLAFFFRSSLTGRVTGFYPSPAGATESELPLDGWEALVRAVPALSTLAPDVEALLIRDNAGELEALIVPIDASYELVGRIRLAWRGFLGGDEVQREIGEFFTRAAARARTDTAA